MFGGAVRRYKHFSDSCGCDMTFSVFVPASGESCSSSTKAAAPIFLFLSGLTCNDENFTQKSGAQRAAASHGIALVAPDTSPRGLGVPGEDEGWDLGTGAGFYVDATQEPWVKQKQQKEGSSSSLSGTHEPLFPNAPTLYTQQERHDLRAVPEPQLEPGE